MITKTFNKLSITGKVITISVGLTILVALAISIPISFLSSNNGDKQLANLEETLRSNYDTNIKQEVETAFSMVDAIYKKHLNSEVSKDSAMVLAADLLRVLNYGEGTYFWADTKEGVNVVLLGSESEGKNRFDLVDQKGNSFIKDIINAGVNGGGYTEYWFAKKGESKPSPKRSYSIYFEPFNWVIGTGNYIDDIQFHLDKEKEKQLAQIKNIIFLIVIITVASIVLAFIGSILFGRTFSRPIIKLAEQTKALSKGNLNIEINCDREDEVGTLQTSLSNTIKQLKNVISEAINSSNIVYNSGSEISRTAENLSQGASRQAASTEEISSSVEEMLSSIESNSENTKITKSSSKEVETGMNQLQDTMKHSLDSMYQIKAKSDIINKIADKTDLLAINAAVEAARAGDAGKGFSVVAGEVRKLSDITKNAALEIEEFSASTLNTVEQSWSNFEDLLPKLQDTVNRINEISTSSNEQNSGAGQINGAVQELVSVTSRNAAASEELASSSEEMTRQSEILEKTISFFTFNN